MARSTKEGLDYFPLDINLDDKIYMVECELGLTGFALLIKLFMKIYQNGYYVDWNDKVAKIFARQNNIEVNVINTFINVCINENIVNGNIYKKYKILTSRGIQKRYLEAIKRRKDVTVFKEYFLLNGNNAYNIPNNVNIISLNDDIKKQSKVEYSKVKESKEIKEVRKAISASLEVKAPANNIEYDQELHSWHGVDDDIIEDWEKRFPNISVGEQLMKIREYFKNNPDKEKGILKKFKGAMPIYVNDWLERAEKYRIENKTKGGN